MAPFMESVEVADWNALQRAIRKAKKPAGRVVARGVVEHAVIYRGRRLVIQLRLDRAPARGSGDVDMGASRVEVREAKGGGA